MGLQRQQSTCVLVVTCCSVLLSILTTMMAVPTLRTDTLLCYFCPLQHRDRSCNNITTQCLPDEVCVTSTGYFGALHVLSAQGCIKRNLCGSHQFVHHKGVRYNAHQACCCKNTCNHPPKADTSLKKLLLGMIRGGKDHVNVSITPVQEETFDSCANYTSPIITRISHNL